MAIAKPFLAVDTKLPNWMTSVEEVAKWEMSSSKEGEDSYDDPVPTVTIMEPVLSRPLRF